MNMPKSNFGQPMTYDLTSQENFRSISQTVLSEDWGRLTKHRFALRRRDGTWQEQQRETYDRGNGAVCLLYNPQSGNIVLTRQFRLPAFVSGHPGYLIEAPAGLLDGADPATRMRLELEEETGFRVDALTHLFDVYMSPGSVTEYLAFFLANYAPSDRRSTGGGDENEGEDLEVIELPLTEAHAMIGDGRICDAKTIILIQHLLLDRHAAR